MLREFYHHKIYIHRERGHVYMPFFKGMSFSDVLNLRIEGFYFDSIGHQDEMSKFGCRVSIFNYEKQRFAGINLNNGKVYFDTKLGINKTLDCFLASLRIINCKIKCTPIKHNYIEICARFPWDKVPEAFELLKTIETIFRTKRRESEIRSHDALNYNWLYLVKDALFGRYLVNIKVYLFFEYNGKKFNTRRITGFGYRKLPKVEVQITGPDNIEDAKTEAISIVSAFLDALKSPSCEMREPDYELVTFPEKYQEGYQQILLHLNRSKSATSPIIFRQKNTRERDVVILNFLAEKPRSVNEIQQVFNMSKNTVRADLKRLEEEGLIYSRGRIGVEKMYAIMLQP